MITERQILTNDCRECTDVEYDVYDPCGRMKTTLTSFVGGTIAKMIHTPVVVVQKHSVALAQTGWL